MNKFTAGPWIVIEEKYYSKEACITSQDRIYNSKGPICELDYIFDGPHGDEQIANMALICAAPDLLEALEMCERSMRSVLPDFNQFDQAAYEKARAAIARARGEA